MACEDFGGAGQQLQVVDNQQIEALLPFQFARARCKLRDGDAAGLVDIERDLAQALRHIDELLEFLLRDQPRRIFSDMHFGLLRQNTCGELLGTHFEREERDDAAVMLFIVLVEFGSRLVGVWRALATL